MISRRNWPSRRNCSAKRAARRIIWRACGPFRKSARRRIPAGNAMPFSRDARIGVVGAGAMGSGIAQIAAASGHPVVVVDSDSAASAAALARVQWHHASGSPGLGALAGCDFVIEAVVETLTVKRDLFIQLERVVKDDCILATNTSSLPVAAIAAACAHPERVLGVHFFNPAPVMALVEIVPALGTAPDVTARTRALADSWGKTTVL